MSDDVDMSRVIDEVTRDDEDQIYRTIGDAVSNYCDLTIIEAAEALRVHDERTVTTTLALMQLKALGNLSSQLSHLLQGQSRLKRQ